MLPVPPLPELATPWETEPAARVYQGEQRSRGSRERAKEPMPDSHAAARGFAGEGERGMAAWETFLWAPEPRHWPREARVATLASRVLARERARARRAPLGLPIRLRQGRPRVGGERA